MAVMLDSYEAGFEARLSSNIDTGLLQDLLNKLHVLGAKPKWTAVAADLAATATEAEATAKPPPPAGEPSAWDKVYTDAKKAADECGNIPAAARSAGGFAGYKYGAFLSKCGSTCCRGGPCPGPNDPPYVYRAMSDGITRMGFVDPNTRSEVQPGTYMTDGGYGPDCHWAKLRSSDPNDIVQKGQGKGVQTVVIDSPYFQSDRCGVWWMVGYPRP